MPKLYSLLTAVAALSFSAIAPAFAENAMVGGAPMLESKNIVQNAANSKDHTTLVAAVKAAGLVDTLSGTGPFTVFAPTNAAFSKLPPGTVDNLLKPENKDKLTKVLKRLDRRHVAVELAEFMQRNHGAVAAVGRRSRQADGRRI
jgi:uncharacterized surface protein with fasciclin (FAS1) repeats